MLHAHPQDPTYRIDPTEEVEDLIRELAFNVQDRHWLVYCALGGHEHYDLPDIDLVSGISIPAFYVEAA